MPIHVTNPEEPGLNMSQATKYFVSSRGNRPAHKSRLIRYITHGVNGPNGGRVYLEALRQGNQWVTTPSAIQAFCEALTPERADVKPTHQTSASRRRASDRAGRELTKRGFR